MSNTEIKAMIAPLMSLIFVAGGGWYTLDAVANDSEELETKVEQIEKRLTNQDVLDVKVEQVEQRLERLEAAIDKIIVIQQNNAQNLAAICASTEANCR